MSRVSGRGGGLGAAFLVMLAGVAALVAALVASFASLATVTFEFNSTTRLPLDSGGYLDALFEPGGRIVGGVLNITSSADGMVILAVGTFTDPRAYTLMPMESLVVEVGPGYRVDVLDTNATTGYLILSIEGVAEARPYSWMAYLGLILFLAGTISSAIGLLSMVGLIRLGGGDEGGGGVQ